jgi:hypothetical protein
LIKIGQHCKEVLWVRNPLEYKIPRSLPQKSDDARAVTLELTVRVLVYFIKSYCFGDFTGAHGERPAKVDAR